MKLNHYEAWIWWYAFAPTDTTPKVFSDYLASLKQGKMEFFGEVMNNGMYEVPDGDLTESYIDWLKHKREDDKRIRESKGTL